MTATVENPMQVHSAGEIEKIYSAHHGRILKAAYRVTGNLSDAEDVLQTIFLRMIRREPGQAWPENLESYLYRAAINAALDVLRLRRESSMVSLDVSLDNRLDNAGEKTVQFASHDPSPERAHASGEVRAWFRAALTKLSPRTAEMFVLRYLEGMGNREIARMLDTSQAVVAVTLFRTRNKLQKDYSQQKKRRQQ